MAQEGRAKGSGAHHFLIAVGVHHPSLAVVAEAHEEGGHKVVTGGQTAVRARLLSPPQAKAQAALFWAQEPRASTCGASWGSGEAAIPAARLRVVALLIWTQGADLPQSRSQGGGPREPTGRV